MPATPYDHQLDASGLQCPMPLIKARQEISKIEVGKVLKVVSTDRGSMQDFYHWAKAAKNVELIHQETQGSAETALYIHYLKRMS